jgi:pyoverdine/dityrosine biosynthesis protein Dit1
MGIHMLPTRDDWLTPWHGVAANLDGQFVLMKRRDVLAMEHELVHIHGRRATTDQRQAGRRLRSFP